MMPGGGCQARKRSGRVGERELMVRGGEVLQGIGCCVEGSGGPNCLGRVVEIWEKGCAGQGGEG